MAGGRLPPAAQWACIVTASPKLACRSVWRRYGPRGHEVFRGGRPPDEALLASPEVIVAVRDVSLDVAEGEIFVIMGLSGSGKSTLVRCMSRLVEPSAGEILFNGRDLLGASAREMIEIRRHRMGMVFQHFALLPHLTVLGNVGFPLEVQGVSPGGRGAPPPPHVPQGGGAPRCAEHLGRRSLLPHLTARAIVG